MSNIMRKVAMSDIMETEIKIRDQIEEKTRLMVDSFVTVGFSEAQAVELITLITQIILGGMR